MQENDWLSWETRDDLESEIREFGDRIAGGQNPLYECRKLKSERFKSNTIEIYGPHRHILPAQVEHTTDRIAYILSITDAAAETCSEALNRIVIIPRVVRSESRLLTHIYNPQNRTLHVYIYPTRFHESVDAGLGARFQNQQLKFPGMIESLLKQLREIQNSGNVDSLHHFIIPTDILDDEELTLLAIAEDLSETVMAMENAI